MTVAALVDQLLCRRCGHSLAAGTCTCRPANPTRLAAAVAARHADAVRRARWLGTCVSTKEAGA